MLFLCRGDGTFHNDFFWRSFEAVEADVQLDVLHRAVWERWPGIGGAPAIFINLVKVPLFDDGGQIVDFEWWTDWLVVEREVVHQMRREMVGGILRLEVDGVVVELWEVAPRERPKMPPNEDDFVFAAAHCEPPGRSRPPKAKKKKKGV